MSQKKQESSNWAPWWLYLVIILGCNYVKQYLVQDLHVALNAAITVVLAGSLFLAITAVHRSRKSPDRQQH